MVLTCSQLKRPGPFGGFVWRFSLASIEELAARSPSGMLLIHAIVPKKALSNLLSLGRAFASAFSWPEEISFARGLPKSRKCGAGHSHEVVPWMLLMSVAVLHAACRRQAGGVAEGGLPRPKM